MEVRSLEPLQLRAMGFCGADDSTSPELLLLLSQHYPFIEWGVLFRPDLEGTPRYASWEWTTKLCQLEAERVEAAKSNEKAAPYPVKLAAHLCGSRCQEILDGNSDFVKDLRILGFRRVQINATKANNVHVDLSNITTIVLNIRACIIAVPTVEWILQCNEETKCICDSFLSDPVINMSILFDSSCGLGIQMKDFPIPSRNDILHGYAGGIGPNNVKEMITKIQEISNGRAVWVDMESSLRTKIIAESGDIKDIFSIEKCFSCIMTGVNCFNLPSI